MAGNGGAVKGEKGGMTQSSTEMGVLGGGESSLAHGNQAVSDPALYLVLHPSDQITSDQSLSRVRFFATP